MTVTSIVPDRNEPDDEVRALACFVQAIEAAQRYQVDVANAREARGATLGFEALRTDGDTLADLAMSYRNALGRRRRDLGGLIGVRRVG